MTEQQIVRSDVPDSPAGPDEVWRDEVQARVARYRTRRGRRVEGTYSMRFPFSPEEEKAKSGQSLNPVAELEPALDTAESNWLGEAEDAVAEPALELEQSVCSVADCEEVVAVDEVQETSCAIEPPDADSYLPDSEVNSAMEAPETAAHMAEASDISWPSGSIIWKKRSPHSASRGGTSIR